MRDNERSDERSERRRSLLTDDDMDRIGEAFDKRMMRIGELIGYDLSTPETRSEIRKDHEFVREARLARAKILGAVIAALGTGLGAWAVQAFSLLK